MGTKKIVKKSVGGQKDCEKKWGPKRLWKKSGSQKDREKKLRAKVAPTGARIAATSDMHFKLLFFIPSKAMPEA
jgi:hypothetical protein